MTQLRRSTQPIRLLAAGIVALAIGAIAVFVLPMARSPLEITTHEDLSSVFATDEPQESKGLSSEARKFIWDVEQQAFQLSQKAFPQFADALTSTNRQALIEFFSEGVHGQVFACGSKEELHRKFADFEFQRKSDHEIISVDREQVVDSLLAFVSLFRSPPKAQVALLYLSPVERSQMDGPWQGTWIVRLFGETFAG